jgi:GGDEF domain-containing protein
VRVRETAAKAAVFFCAMKSVKDQVRDQVEGQVFYQVDDQVRVQVRNQVWYQVGDQVLIQVGIRIRDKVLGKARTEP